MSVNVVTLELFADHGPKGLPVREEVRARSLGNRTFEVAQSPGLVLGIAAGDVIELDSQDQSRFHVRKRGGNICVQLFFPAVSDKLVDSLTERMLRIGAWLDGRSAKELVFSVPYAGDFGALEATLNELVAAHPGSEWYYGNVYDPKDGTTPLNWWLQKS